MVKTPSNLAASVTVWVKGPTTLVQCEHVTTPSRGTNSLVGLTPTEVDELAGDQMEPAVLEPKATIPELAAMATTEPDDNPDAN